MGQYNRKRHLRRKTKDTESYPGTKQIWVSSVGKLVKGTNGWKGTKQICVSSVGKLMKGANGRNIDNKIQNKQNEKLSGMWKYCPRGGSTSQLLTWLRMLMVPCPPSQNNCIILQGSFNVPRWEATHNCSCDTRNKCRGCAAKTEGESNKKTIVYVCHALPQPGFHIRRDEQPRKGKKIVICKTENRLQHNKWQKLCPICVQWLCPISQFLDRSPPLTEHCVRMSFTIAWVDLHILVMHILIS